MGQDMDKRLRWPERCFLNVCIETLCKNASRNRTSQTPKLTRTGGVTSTTTRRLETLCRLPRKSSDVDLSENSDERVLLGFYWRRSKVLHTPTGSLYREYACLTHDDGAINFVSSDYLSTRELSLTSWLSLGSKVRMSSREATVDRRKRRGTYQACT
jgi:hypothetical protein